MTSQTKAELAEELDRVALRGYIKDSVATLPSELLDRILAALRAEPAGEPEQCPLCKGTGHRPVTSFADHNKTIMKSCSACKGRGTLNAHPPSPSALAEGWVAVPREPTDHMLFQGMIAGELDHGHQKQSGLTATLSAWNAMLSALPPVAGEAK